jgi:hypothetical protein
VHRQFKTMIVQAENGRVRLKNEFADLDCATLDEFVRVCSPPPFGFAFDKLAFCDQLRREIENFSLMFSFLIRSTGWRGMTRRKDYAEAFEDLLSVLPTGDDAPAIGHCGAHAEAASRGTRQRAGVAQFAGGQLRHWQRAANGFYHAGGQR